MNAANAANAPSATIEPPVLDPASPAIGAFLEGTATHAHELLGAHLRDDGSVHFAVWAPNAERVDVIGDFEGWNGLPLFRLARGGIFAGRVRGALLGQRYKFRITGRDGSVRDRADPFGYAAEVAPGNASVIARLGHAWTDDAWMKDRAAGARLDRPISIYEVHLGSWRRHVEDGGRTLGYREIAAPLAEHAARMGFTHVELMPVLEHPYYGSWGYGVTGFFAATSRYGSPEDLMFLVDTLHAAGLGVIFDWVPAHFARDEHGLASFDGSPTFEPPDPARAIHPTWGSGLFDYARPEVRSFLLSSAVFWVERFHADGLRVDGVESILYVDHGRPEGTYAPNQLGGRENLAGIEFLQQLTSTLKLEAPAVLLAAEDSSARPGVTHGPTGGGLGFDLKWDMGFSHDLRRYLAMDPIHRSQHQSILTFRSVYGPNESFILPLSHDEVIAERGGGLLQQMNGDRWQKLANLRLLYTLAWAQPGKKLLFMGCEFAQSGPWHHDRSLDWHELADPAHGGIARLVGDLNRVYRETPALHQGDASPSGFEWIDGTNAEMSVITFLRRGGEGSEPVVVACNFTPVPRPNYRIGVPRAGHFREIFNSDARHYGGSGHGNMGGVEAVPVPWDGRQSSIVVTLPPLGIIFLARG
jgi:1,4-alpha-glucan branching enzyme